MRTQTTIQEGAALLTTILAGALEKRGCSAASPWVVGRRITLSTRRKASQAEFVCHLPGVAAGTSGSENTDRAEILKHLAGLRRRTGLVRDLVAVRSPIAARRDATMEAQQLARDIVAGRLTIAEARAQMRGAA